MTKNGPFVSFCPDNPCLSLVFLKWPVRPVLGPDCPWNSKFLKRFLKLIFDNFFNCFAFFIIKIHGCRAASRLRVVPHLSSGIVERAKRERAWKSPHARKGDTRRRQREMRDYRQSSSFWTYALLSQHKTLIFFSPHRVSPFARGMIFTRARGFARSTIPEEKWGTTRSLSCVVPRRLKCGKRDCTSHQGVSRSGPW